MTRVRFRNLIFDWTREEGDFMGDTHLLVPTKIWEQYFKFHNDEPPAYSDEFCVKSHKRLSTIYNADTYIHLFNWCLEVEKERKFHFDFNSKYISWIHHDFNHAKQDIYGSSIYTDQYIEKERITRSLIWAFKRHHEILSYDDLEKFQEVYNKRFFNKEKSQYDFFLEELWMKMADYAQKRGW